MSSELRFTILGCGSSGGVPRLGGHWGACDPTNPKNRRRRCSMLIERITGSAITRVLIDTSPDMRDQLLTSGVGELDAVVYTHAHADHVHGIDDLRMVVFNMKKRLPIYADVETCNALMDRFGYAFVQPKGSMYPPILDMNLIDGPINIMGAGGDITLIPFHVDHGNIRALGFRIGGLVYLPDVSAMNDTAWDVVRGSDCWVVDALRYTPHPSHSHYEQTLEWIAQSGVKHGVLTNMHLDLDYSVVERDTPANISAAYDGMTITYPI